VLATGAVLLFITTVIIAKVIAVALFFPEDYLELLGHINKGGKMEGGG
jgi:hypothetical protein